MPTPSLREQLLKQTEEFCGERGVSPREVGVAVMNDPGFFTRVRKGGGFTVKTFERFQAYFAANRPQRASASHRDADAA